MNRFFSGIGTMVVRRRWFVLVVWAALLLFGFVYAPRLQEVFEREFVTGNTGDSQRAADVVAAEFTTRSAFQEQLVFSSDLKLASDPAYRQAVESVIAAVEQTGLVTGVESYYVSGDPRLLSADGGTTYAPLNLRSTTHADGMLSSERIIEAVKLASPPAWLNTYVTGTEAIHADLTTGSQESLSRAERVGLPVALLVLVLVFGALVAATLPLLLGALSIAIALALAFVVGQAMNLSVFVETFATMLGLGVGIDYALFILTRYRAERRAGRDVASAVVETVTHAGKAIAFSGLTVVLGLSALLATGEPTVSSIGIGGVLVVLVAVLAALTLLPAVLVLLGDRIELPVVLTQLIERVHRGGFWAGWARRVMRRPVRYALAGLILIGAIAWPTLGLETGSLGVKLLDEKYQSRQGYELLDEQFGSGLTSPVQVVIRSETGIDQPAMIAGIDRLTSAIQADPRFAGAISITALAPDLSLERHQALYANDFAGVPPELAGSLSELVNVQGDADTTVVLGLLATDPGSQAARDTVRAVRDDVVPNIPELRGAEVLVGGTTAIEMDAVDALYARFPVVIGLILVTTFVLLMILFRSILIPLKAVIMNLLSVFGAYGLLVLVFQEGFGDDLFGFQSIGEVNWITPVLLFAVLFGLSMDYEVFLMSRMRELHDRGHSNEESVAMGLERTGGVITGAALIMVVVFGAFILADILVVKELGFALAVAVLLDATIVRVILVPATMRLLGEWNWWLPSFLERMLPRVELERDVLAPAGDD